VYAFILEHEMYISVHETVGHMDHMTDVICLDYIHYIKHFFETVTRLICRRRT